MKVNITRLDSRGGRCLPVQRLCKKLMNVHLILHLQIYQATWRKARRCAMIGKGFRTNDIKEALARWRVSVLLPITD